MDEEERSEIQIIISEHITQIDVSPSRVEVVTASQGIPGVPGRDADDALEWVVLDNSTIILENYLGDAGEGYLVQRDSLTRILLPTYGTFEPGARMTVWQIGASPWRVVQSEGNRIQIGNKSTTPGITGFIQSTGIGDRLDLCYVGAGVWFAVNTGHVEVV